MAEKPPNMLSQGDKTGDPDILTLLKQDLKERFNKPGNVYLGLVHRLDRPVGGVMVFAKTSKAAARLAEQICGHRFEKTYIAIIHGVPEKKTGTLVHYLLKNRQTNMVVSVNKGTPGAKEAVLDYEVVGSSGDLCLVKIILGTGRSHQIRVQFSSIGHPLYGDKRYGLEDSGKQIALWACELSLEHPTKRERMTFTSMPEKKAPWDLIIFDRSQSPRQ